MCALNKIVWALINPLTVIWVIICVGVVLILCSKKTGKRYGRLLLGVGLILAWVWSTPLMSRILGCSLEREFLVEGRVPRVESFPAADAIVLLGGGMSINTNVNDYAEMNSAADRVWQAARLYQAGKSYKIIITSISCKENTQGLLNDFGVPDEAIAYGGMPSQNTEGEAKEMSRLLTEMLPLKPRPKILLVTSAWHMKRAKYLFEKYAKNLEIIPAPADFEAAAAFGKNRFVNEFIPSGGGLLWNVVYLHEWVGYWGYMLFRK